MTMRSITEKRTRALLGCGLAALFLASCGGDDSDSTEGGASTDPQTEATNPVADNFPAADSKSLAQIAKEAKSGLTLAPGTQVYTPGENRLAFGLLDADNAIVYAPTAVYVGKSPSAPAQGPFVAPTDSLITELAYRSRNAATEAGPFAHLAELLKERFGISHSTLQVEHVPTRLLKVE